MAKIILKENFHLRDENDKTVDYNSSSKDNKEYNYYSYFACTCDEDDKQYWKQRLIEYMPEFDPNIHADLVSQLVMEINHTYNGSISIDSDMWFGIDVTCSIWNDTFTEYEVLNVFMQCDEVSIGLMAIVDILSKVVQDD